MTMLGATFNPCPTVPVAPVPVYVTTLHPLVVLALTDDVIEPLVLDTAVPPPFHCQPTTAEPFALPPEIDPIEKPFELNAVIEFAADCSASVLLDAKYNPVPRTESANIWLLALVLFFTHTKSG